MTSRKDKSWGAHIDRIACIMTKEIMVRVDHNEQKGSLNRYYSYLKVIISRWENCLNFLTISIYKYQRLIGHWYDVIYLRRHKNITSSDKGLSLHFWDPSSYNQHIQSEVINVTGLHYCFRKEMKNIAKKLLIIYLTATSGTYRIIGWLPSCTRWPIKSVEVTCIFQVCAYFWRLLAGWGEYYL